MKSKILSSAVLVGLAAITLLIPSFSPAQQKQSVPADEFAAGGANCDWNTGACDMLQAYVNQHGSDRTCRALLQKGVELERQERQLLKGAVQSNAIDNQAADLEQKRDAVLKTLPPDCFSAGPHSNTPSETLPNQPNPTPATNDSYPPGAAPIGPFACSTCPGGKLCYFAANAWTVSCVSAANSAANTGASCLDALGRLISGCQPAEAEEQPEDIQPGTYQISQRTRQGTGYVSLPNAGTGVVTGTNYKHALQVTYNAGSYGTSGTTNITWKSKTTWNGDSNSSIFVIPAPISHGSLLKPQAKIIIQQLGGGIPSYNVIWKGKGPGGADLEETWTPK